MPAVEELVEVAPDMVSGVPVFRGTRVTVQKLWMTSRPLTLSKCFSRTSPRSAPRRRFSSSSLPAGPHWHPRVRVLLDESLPSGLKGLLQDLDITTVPERGWRGLKNGDLLTQADPPGARA